MNTRLNEMPLTLGCLRFYRRLALAMLLIGTAMRAFSLQTRAAHLGTHVHVPWIINDHGSKRAPSLPLLHLPQPDRFSVMANVTTHRKLHPAFLPDERLVAVTAVIVIGAKPVTSGKAATFLHERYAFIQELVLWNNANMTMDHRLLSADLATRYVTAPRDYGNFARVLGCLLARHEICYFQRVTLRPTFLDSGFATFLRAASAEAERPSPTDAIVVASADAAFDNFVRRERTFKVASEAGPCDDTHVFTIIDWDEGVFAHKNVAKRHVRNLQVLDGGRRGGGLDGTDSLTARIRYKAVVSDLLLSYGLPRRPVILTHDGRIRANAEKLSHERSWQGRMYSRDITIDAATLIAPFLGTAGDGSLIGLGRSNERDSNDPAKATRCNIVLDTHIDAYLSTFKAPCLDRRCTFVTNMRPVLQKQPVAHDAYKRRRILVEAVNPLRSLAGRMRAGRLDAVETFTYPTTHAYYAAVDGDLDTTWLPTWPLEDDGAESPYVGVEMLAPTLVAGARLVFAPGPQKLPIDASSESLPQLEYAFLPSVQGVESYKAAVGCVAEWSWASGRREAQEESVHTGQIALTYSCPPARVYGARLLFVHVPIKVNAIASPSVGANAGHYNGALGITELALVDLPTRAISPLAGGSGGRRHYNLSIAYALDLTSMDDPATRLCGKTLALLEEACELGAAHPGDLRTTIIVRYMNHGDDPKLSAPLSLNRLATAFAAVSGSTCDLEASTRLVQLTSLQPVGSSRSVGQWDVVFVELGDDAASSPLPQALWENLPRATILVARMTSWPHLNTKRLQILHIASYFDCMTVPNKETFVTLVTIEGGHKHKDVRIMYPLRTLPRPPFEVPEARHVLTSTPTNPPVEELILLTTATTDRRDLQLFESFARPIFRERGVFIRIVNVTELVKQALAVLDAQPMRSKSKHDAWKTSSTMSSRIELDDVMKRHKWKSVREIARYAATYPGRVIWILDGSPSAAYFASAASSEGARFVASPAAIPHNIGRLLAWNATAEWTRDGFNMKARELTTGRFYWSSSVHHRDFLKADAHDIVLDEWPPYNQRKVAVIAYTTLAIKCYVTSLMPRQRPIDRECAWIV